MTLESLLKGNPSARTKEYEGFSPSVYVDSVGKRTIGYGFNLDDPLIAKMIPGEVATGQRPIGKDEADQIFNVLYDNAAEDAITFVGGNDNFYKLPQEAQNVLVDMSYNMGINRLSNFKKMKSAAINGDMSGMAKEMQDSKWYKQTGRRSKELVDVIRGIK